MIAVEFVTFDPADEDTYPSVCADAGEVKARFGFEGGEQLVFDDSGSYLGQLVKQFPAPRPGIGTKVRLATDLNGGRYQGRRAEVVDVLPDGRVVVKLAEWTPGLEPPDGLVWLRDEEVEPA